jgi:hypothetical protein
MSSRVLRESLSPLREMSRALLIVSGLAESFAYDVAEVGEIQRSAGGLA